MRLAFCLFLAGLVAATAAFRVTPIARAAARQGIVASPRRPAAPHAAGDGPVAQPLPNTP